jgi:hypothetical protein
MKKIISIIAVLLIAMGINLIKNSSVIFADEPIKVAVNGQYVDFNGQNPVIIDGRTLIPVRGVFEYLGFSVDWNSDSQQVFIINDDYTVVMAIGDNEFTTNGESHNMDVPSQIISGRTMLPIRAVLESVGYYIEWEDTTRTITINTQHSPPDSYLFPSASTFEVYDQLANAATDIVIGIATSYRRANESTITLRVDSTFKGTLSYDDEIVVHLIGDYINHFFYLSQWGYVFFLRAAEDGSFHLLNDSQSIYEYEYDSRYSFISISNNDYINEIHYDNLLNTWDNNIQELSEANPALQFTSRAIRGGYVRRSILAGEYSEYPMPCPFVILSKEEFARYPILFNYFEEEYPEEFFEDSFLIVLEFSLTSGSIHLEVDTILENGDIFITQISPFMRTDDRADWLVLIEVANETIPEQFNIILNNKLYINTE